MMRKTILSNLAIALLAAAPSIGHEKVRLTGYVVDVRCASGHSSDRPEAANRFAAGHTRKCSLAGDCSRSGYGILSNGRLRPFDARGNALAEEKGGDRNRTDG